MNAQGPTAPAAAENRPATAGFVPATAEAGAWLAVLSLAGLAFSLAGAFGFAERVDPADVDDIHSVIAQEGFSLRTGALAYALVGLLGAAGLLAPALKLSRLRTLQAGVGAAAVAAVLAAVLFFYLTTWLAVLTAAAVGAAVAALLSALPAPRHKPWRSAGVPVAALLIATSMAQILGGVGAGHTVLRGMALVGAVVLLAGVALLLFRPSTAVELPEAEATGAFPARHRLPVRESAQIDTPWVCHVLFFVLGAVAVMAQPATVDVGYGQAGVVLIICALLLGWAAGFEIGPTFAPGMSRPRLTAFALLGAGLLTVVTGALTELSGRAVLSGCIAFLVGLGVRAQEYRFTRRVGTGLGMFAGLALTALGVYADIPLSANTIWHLTATEFAYETVGLVALVAGAVALFTFGPHGIHGIGVDIVTAFRVPAQRNDDPVPAPAAPSEHDLRAQDAENSSASGSALGGLAPSSGSAQMHGGPGLFIALEGGDGSGKSTQIRLLAEALRNHGIGEVVTTREPGGTPAGTQLRSVVLDGEGVSPRAEALVFAADRAHHVATLVRPVLERGGVALTDRYIDSSRAYQAAGRLLGEEEVTALSVWATEGLVPDLTLVLDADPNVTGGRTTARGEENHLDREGQEFRQTVREAFLGFAAQDPARYRVVNAAGTIDEVSERLREAVHEALDLEPLRSQEPQHLPDETVDYADIPAQEAETTVLSPEDGSPAEAEHAGSGAGVHTSQAPDSGEESTTVLRAHTAEDRDTQIEPKPPRQSDSRERLRIQAQIERQARERLRAQRDGGHG